MDPLPAYILSGGRSLRFGADDDDKARALLDGKPLIVHAAQALHPLASSITIVADTADKYPDLDLFTIADQHPEIGPIGGLESALLDCTHNWLLLTSCDFVDIQPVWIEELAERMDDRYQAVTFRDDRWQPMPGLYHASILPTVRSHIDFGQYSMQALLNAAEVCAVSPPTDWPAKPGINTSDELARRAARRSMQ